MTSEEAKKYGFRTAGGALYVYWCIENGHIYVRSCDACALTENDFPTREKARDALRKQKADAEHAKWLADMQSQTTPITPEQAHALWDGDTVCWPARDGSIQQGEWGKSKQWFTDCPFWFTLEAYRTSLANQKSVESHETPVGETQGKEVVTDETQHSPSRPLSDAEFKNLVGRMSLSQLYDALKANGVKLEGIGLEPKKVDDQSILEEAAKCVTGPRRRDYGTPDENFGLIASLWSVQLKHEVTSMQVAMCLILLKVARQANSPKRDNLVDIAGYAQCASELKGAK